MFEFYTPDTQVTSPQQLLTPCRERIALLVLGCRLTLSQEHAGEERLGQPRLGEVPWRFPIHADTTACAHRVG